MENHSKPMDPSNLSDIDIFRGMAAFIVVAMHTRMYTWVGFRELWKLYRIGNVSVYDAILGSLTFPLVWGSIGVPIFFVLSGYCIHRSQALIRVRRGTFQLSSGRFFLRRFFRIYPVLVGALLLTFICDWTSRYFIPCSRNIGDTGTRLFLVNLFSLQGIVGRPYGSNGALWTLSIEVQFYALYPLLLATMRRLGNVATLSVLLIINIVSWVVFERHGLLLFSSYYVSWYLGCLVAEAEAAGLMSNRLASAKFRGAVFGLCMIVLCAGCGLFFLDRYVAFQVWAFGFSIFLLAILKRPTAFRGQVARFFRWLGTFSYSVYIVHLPIVALIFSMVFSSVPRVSIMPALVTLSAAIGCAYVFSLAFERPALALSKMLKNGPRVHTPETSV